MIRTRQRRNLINGEAEKVRNDINELIEENGMKYVLIQNNIFDEMYMKESIQVIDEQTGVKEGLQFTELDMVVYIFLQFMMVNKFTLKYERFADYVGCSSKQLKVSLKRLQRIKGKTNAIYYPYEDKIKIVDEMEVSLISEKIHTAYNPKMKKTAKSLHWYTNFIPYYKSTKKDDKEILSPINFFMVTIEDFALLTNGTLTRNEFITYLFLLRVYKYGTSDDKQMYWKLSTIAEHLNYRLVETVHKHIEKLLSVKVAEVSLLEEIRPKNYDMQIMKGEEPSSRYIPRYNPSKMLEMNFGIQEMSSEKVEMDSTKVEMSFQKEEDNSEKEEVDSKVWETDFKKREMDLAKEEVDFDNWEEDFMN